MVCIEEIPACTGMTMRLDSNSENLSRITNFKGIAHTLQKTALRGMTVLVQRTGDSLIQDFNEMEGGC